MTEDQKKTHKYLAVYGSLRPGMYNNMRLGEAVTLIEDNVQLTGYKMFELADGAYPCVVYTGNDKDKITVTLFKVDDKDALEGVYYMERCAGYTAELVTVKAKNRVKQKYVIYLYPKTYSNKNEIKGGDWLKHVNELLPEHEKAYKGRSSWW